MNGPISGSYEFIKDEANDLLEELQCPPNYIAKMLKSIARDFERKEKENKYQEQESQKQHCS